MINLRTKKLSTLLPFPSLISLLYRNYEVPFIPKINWRIICTRVIDITHFQDEDNPIGIKRNSLILVDLVVGDLPSLEGVKPFWFLHLIQILLKFLMMLLLLFWATHQVFGTPNYPSLLLQYLQMLLLWLGKTMVLLLGWWLIFPSIFRLLLSRG